MAKLKTAPNDLSVTEFLDSIEDEQKRTDSYTLLAKMERISGVKPIMWGSSIVGFGRYQYKYKSGREGEWFMTGFSPRKNALTLYLMGGLDQQADLLEKLGKYKTGKGCLYIKRLSDVEDSVLEEMISLGVSKLKAQYPED
ncbi:MAG: DUF1801 domain-containing protein [Bacteroidota bacterium]